MSADPFYEIWVGDWIERLRTMPSASADACVTSPPYWRLRDYGVAGQLGVETTPQEFVAKLVEGFREVFRVLKPGHTCWINLGDNYADDRKWGGSSGNKHTTALHGQTGIGRLKVQTGLKPKDLCMMPHRVAIALQDDGWWVRDDIVWHKPNPMPSSAKDRTTKAHEYLFLLANAQDYFYNSEAIFEPAVSEPASWPAPLGWDMDEGSHGTIHKDGRRATRSRDNFRREGSKQADIPGKRAHHRPDQADTIIDGRRNARSVWTIPPQAYKGSHYATFPEELARRCILAGCPEGGVVLDPFVGSGTTMAVAKKLGRSAIGIDLDPRNVPQIERRLAAVTTPLALFGGGDG